VAELVAGEGDDIEYSSQAAALAVLAGTAASDAACCKALGRRSRAPDHQEASKLVEQVSPGDLKSALRHANGMIEFAEKTMRR
jgi:hypothetical protein